jgi:hypothetical protein
MKRLLFPLMVVTVALVFACQPAPREESKNANAAPSAQAVSPPAMTTSDKIVQIFIHDDPSKPGYYEIEDPGSVTLHKRKNQKIAWCVVYDGSTPPSEVVVDNFRMPPPPASPTATNPFGDGGAEDNRFIIPSADFNACRHGTKTPKANVELGTYKYAITVRVNGADRGSLDPGVIITD